MEYGWQAAGLFSFVSFNYTFQLKFEKIDSGIKLDNNMYNQKLPHFQVMTKWMASYYFFIIIYRFYDRKVVVCHPLCHNLEMWKLLVILVISKLERVFPSPSLILTFPARPRENIYSTLNVN